MNLSGILVTAEPVGVLAVLADLALLPGVEVRQCDAALGRIVVVQEAADVAAEMDGFSRIRGLPHVVNADLVCHYFGDESEACLGAEPASVHPGTQADSDIRACRFGPHQAAQSGRAATELTHALLPTHQGPRKPP